MKKTKYYLAFKCTNEKYQSAFVGAINPKSPLCKTYTVGKSVVFHKRLNGFLADIQNPTRPLLLHGLNTGNIAYCTKVLVVKLQVSAYSGTPDNQAVFNLKAFSPTLVPITAADINAWLLSHDPGEHFYPGTSRLTVLCEVSTPYKQTVVSALSKYGAKYNLPWIPAYDVFTQPVCNK